VNREYPERPIVGVGGVILLEGKVVLIRRRFEPLAGRWSLPGGMLEVGETLEAGVSREMTEETGLEIEVGPVIEVFDRITYDKSQRVQFHFVLVDYLCWPSGGQLQAGSDVDRVVLAAPSDFQNYNLTEKVTEVIGRALKLADQVIKGLRDGNA
jgi:mutator protein MutT